MKTRGFTLVELLVVIVILGILITLGSKTLRAAKLNAKKAQAQVEMKSIETAVQAYHSKYGKLPSTTFNSDQQIDWYSESKTDAASSDIIAVLTQGTNDVDNLNPAEVVFLDAQSSDSTDQYVDPWGYQYRIALDTDYNGRLQVDNLTQLRRKVAVASVGLFYVTGGTETNDLITSWR